MFTVLVAADLGGKSNFEFTFPQKPSLPQLRSRVEPALAAESALRTPSLFEISRIQVFDERLQMWVDLVASVQLENYCQLYAFQLDAGGETTRDLPGHIPPPQRACEPPYAPSMPAPSIPRQHAYSSPLRYRSQSPPPPSAYRSASPHLERRHYPISFGDTSPHVSPARQRPLSIPIEPVVTGAGCGEYDKVRAVFEELDRSHTRRVNPDDWTNAFERTRLAGSASLSGGTVSDLFEKADRDKDGLVTLHEFQVFATDYPKLIDSLYYRLRSLVHETARKANLQRARDEERADQERYEKSAEAALSQESTVLEQQRRAELAELDVQDAQAKEQDSKTARDRAHSESEAARQQVREQIAQADAAKEQVRRQEAQVQAAKRAADVADKKVSQKHNESQRAARELEKLRQLVQQKQEELERLENQKAEAEADAVNQRENIEREKEAKAESERKVDEETVKVTEKERELRGRLEDENSAVQDHRETQRTVASAAHAAQKQQQELQQQKKLQDNKNQAKERASVSLDNCKRLVSELEQRDRELDEKRRGEEERENTIVESEIRLREQRLSVEQREQALSQAHTDFALETGRTSPRRSFDRPRYTSEA
eukprot:Hpha_TRINITY_DN16936_c0_g7::TRINITY_DN16936_c0_g7_i1::g.56656::m.56656